MMLTRMPEFLLQLRWTGRFGNRLLQYGYGATYALRTGLDYYLPADWEGTRLFERQPHAGINNDEVREALAAPDADAVRTQAHMALVHKHYPTARLVDTEALPDPYFTPGHPICHANGGAFNPAIFAGMSRRHLQDLCAFSDEVKNLRSYKRYSDMQGLYDVAHLRRDLATADRRGCRAEQSTDGLPAPHALSYVR